MRALLVSALAVALMLNLATPTPAQAPLSKAPAGTTIQAKVVRIAPTNDFFVVQTTEGREVTLYPSPQTTYQLGTRTAQFRDLRPGANITVVYDVQDNRNLVNTVTFADNAAPAAAPPPAAPPAQAPAGT